MKIGLVCVALAWGAFHHFVVRPALDRADDGFLSRIGRSLARREPRRRSPCCSSRRSSSTRGRRRGRSEPSNTSALPGGSAATLTPVKFLVAALAAASRRRRRSLKVDAGEPTYGLAASGGSVWAGGLGSGNVLRIDPASRQGAESHLDRRARVQPRRRAGRGLGDRQPDEHRRANRHAHRQGDRFGARRQRAVRHRMGLRIGLGLQLARRAPSRGSPARRW